MFESKDKLRIMELEKENRKLEEDCRWYRHGNDVKNGLIEKLSEENRKLRRDIEELEYRELCRKMDDRGYLTPERILAKIRWEVPKSTVVIIMGKSGPTGKTWLWKELRKIGFCNTFELSEDIYNRVEYTDSSNSVRFANERVVVILNETLPQYRK